MHKGSSSKDFLFIVVLVFSLGTLGCSLTSKVGYLMEKNPTKNDPDTVARGQAIFLKNCAECHGPTAHGGLQFPVVVPDLVEYAAQHSEQKVAYKIASGKLFHMPDFDSYIGEKEIWDVTNYLKSLAAHGG